MNPRSFNLLTLLIFLSISIFSQNVAENEDKEKSNELKEKAIVLLRETTAEIDTLRTTENRISFRAETADLMWYYDAGEGKRMFGEVTDSFVLLLSRYNAAVNAFDGVKNESEIYRSKDSANEQSKAIRRLYQALNVRQQIAISIATHDALLGYDFVVRTSDLITGKSFKEKIDIQDEILEWKIITLLSEQDIDKALALGRKSLKRKFRSSLLNFLTKVYEKDKDKGIAFAKEIIDTVSSEMKEPNSNLSDVQSILTFGINNLAQTKTQTEKTPIFSENELTELAKNFADILLRRADIREDYQLEYYYLSIKRFSPSSAERLKAKYKDVLSDMDDGKGDFAVDKAVDAAKDAVDKAKDAMDKEVDLSAEEKAKQAVEEGKRSLFEALQDSDDKKLSDQEKAKFISEARKIIATMDEPTEKIVALSALAFKVKQLGDKKLASELMDEASYLVNQQPRNYIEFLLVWTLAGGYSVVDADKAFPILEDTVYRLNDTITAFVKVAEFMDVSDEIVFDNEVQIGSFGGSITRDMTRTLKNVDVVMENLARADFARTKFLADRFERTEVRIFAKMLILRSILGDKKETGKSNDMFDTDGFLK